MARYYTILGATYKDIIVAYRGNDKKHTLKALPKGKGMFQPIWLHSSTVSKQQSELGRIFANLACSLLDKYNILVKVNNDGKVYVWFDKQ